MPSFMSDAPSAAPASGGSWFTGGDAALLGLGAIGSLGSMVESGRRRKKLAALRQSMMNEIDTGASSAKGAIGMEARNAQGAAYQGAVNRGFANSSVASDAATNVALNAGQRMGGIDAQAGRDRADVLADTFDGGGGGQDMSGMGQAVGLLLAQRLAKGGQSQTDEQRATPGGSAVTQSLNKSPAMLTPGGDPGLSSGTYDNALNEPSMLERLNTPVAEQDAVGALLRKRRPGMSGYGRPSSGMSGGF